MRQIAAGLFTSLDGVVESPEKWTGPYFNDQVPLTLTKSEAFGTGVVHLTYEPVS